MAKRSKSKGKRSALGLCSKSAACPVISTQCKKVTPLKTVTETIGLKNGKKKKLTYKMKGDVVKICNVKLGSKVVAKGLKSDEAGKKVNDLRNMLIDRNCVAVVKKKDANE